MVSLFGRQKPRLLLDECVSIRLLVNSTTNRRFQIEHTLDIQELGKSASDNEIIRHLHRGEYDLFVTADRALIKDCQRHGINVVQYNRGNVYFDNGEVLKLGTNYRNWRLKEAHRKNRWLTMRDKYFDLRRRFRKRLMKRIRRFVRNHLPKGKPQAG